MGLGPFGASAPLSLRNGELLGHSPIHNISTTYPMRIEPHVLLFGSVSKWYLNLMGLAKLFVYCLTDIVCVFVHPLRAHDRQVLPDFLT
jgi:hypothetical protein